jgi:RNA polymerase sigma factor (sigma-70 family)
MGGTLKQIHHLFVEGTAAGLADGPLLERFLARGDEAAFAALVQRHGPMVLRACRAVLAHPEDVEDAFQATFLMLVCKGRSIRGRQALGAWLGQVAHRVAVRAGVESARRRACERRAVATRSVEIACAEPADDWQQVVHEELARLSDRYRLPLLLCDLEGKTHAEAALELGCGPATVQRRLTAARDLLRSRLTRRGFALSAGALAAALGRPATAAVPPEWIEATVAAARSLTSRAARLAIGQVAATAAEALARRSMRSTVLGRLTAIAAVSVALVALGGFAWSAGAARPDEPGAVRPSPAPAQPSMSSTSKKPVARRDDDTPGTVAFHGRVVDPEGRSVAGATLHLAGEGLAPAAFRTVRATSGPDGRFEFEVRGEEFILRRGEPARKTVSLVARAAGYACGLDDGGDASGESTVTLARDDAPIAGRIVNLEGRPVAGVSVKVMEVRLRADGMDPDVAFAKTIRVVNAVRPVYGPYGRSFQAAVAGFMNSGLKDTEERKEWDSFAFPLLLNRAGSEPAAAFIPDATTDRDGRFRIAGIGHGRIATLQLDGPTIETTKFDVRTWPGAPIHIPLDTNPRSFARRTIYGATFEHVAGPTRPIEGIVRDRQTGRPLADILVYARHPRRLFEILPVRAITDADGRYRLVGLPLGREGQLVVVPACDSSTFSDGFRIDPRLPVDRCPPYFAAEASVPKSPGKEPVHLDIALDRGVRVTGRILDKDTGKPVRGRVSYFVFDDNPHAKGGPHPAGGGNLHFTDVDGTFRLVVPPGPGVLAAYVFGPYVRAAGVEAIKSRRPDWLAHARHRIRYPDEYHAYGWIEPAADVSSVTRDLVVVPGAWRPPARLGL